MLRFTTRATDAECCQVGDRVPALVLHSNGTLYVSTQIGDNGAWNYTHNYTRYLNQSTWYALEMNQFEKFGKVCTTYILLQLLKISSFSSYLRSRLMEK